MNKQTHIDKKSLHIYQFFINNLRNALLRLLLLL